MDLERFETLLTVIDCGSLSAAAGRLGYTPSAISRMMASLENELGFSLLYRGKNGVTPTNECKMFLPSVRNFVYSGHCLSQTAARIHGAECGTIIIGTAYSYYYRWITKMSAAFHDLHPGIQFRIVNGTSSELQQMISLHQADFCLISEREGDHNWILLRNDPMVALIPPGHPLAKERSVPMEAFAVESYIQTYPGQDVDNARIFSRCHITPNTQFSTMDINATYSMVEAGLGIGINNQVNSSLWQDRVVHLPLEPAQTMNIGLAYGKNISPASESFLHFIEGKLPE